MAPILGIFASSASVDASATYQSIATITASGGETSLSFTSIPQTYTHLQMRYFIRGSDAGTVAYSNISINGNAYGTNYSGHTVQGDGSTASATNIVSGGGIGNLYSPGSSATANVFASGIVDLLDYTNTNKNKVVRVLHGHDTNGGGQIIFGGGQLLSTATVTSIGIFNMTFVAGSRLALYGIKG
jgi:hypothetical protein